MGILHQRLPLGLLDLNEGQIPGVPENPREWRREELELLKKSIKSLPLLLDARGIIVYPWEGRYVAIGGNMRVTALQELGEEEAPCIICPEDTPKADLKEMAIKDNGSFGAWDFDVLANKWNDIPYTEWGLPKWLAPYTTEESGEDVDLSAMKVETVAKEGKSSDGMQSMTFVMTTEEAEIVQSWIGRNSKADLVAKIVELCRSVEAK